MQNSRIQQILSKKSRLCIGLMSGTSMDGIDAALVNIEGSGAGCKISIPGWINKAYPDGLREKMLTAIGSDSISLSDLSQLNFLLGELFAEAVLELLQTFGFKPEDADLVGSHGQTVWHNPKAQRLFGRNIRSTLQLAEPSVISARTGIVTVADFRTKDMAVGGEGAPLIPYFDYLFLRSDNENRAALNLGGIANITVIPAGADSGDVYAFDTGPANMLIDQAMMRLYGKGSDRNGMTAASAAPDKRLLSKLMRHPFIRKHPPKSTGREMFGAGYIEKVLSWAESLGCTPVELMSTVTEFTVASFVKNYELFIKPNHRLNRIILNGGGANNSELMRRFRSHPVLPAVETIDDYGIPSDIKEAVAFAVYANETISGNAINIPSVTGAETAVVSGKICL